MYPHYFKTDRLLADHFEETLPRLDYLFSFEAMLLQSNIDISDSDDSRKCSRAMQILRKRKLIRYRPSYRQWQNNLKLISNLINR